MRPLAWRHRNSITFIKTRGLSEAALERRRSQPPGNAKDEDASSPEKRNGVPFVIAEGVSGRIEGGKHVAAPLKSGIGKEEEKKSAQIKTLRRSYDKSSAWLLGNDFRLKRWSAVAVIRRSMRRIGRCRFFICRIKNRLIIMKIYY
ncbi:hypothetical protein GWI33_018751 [Rhynchophorus ferrugineus]|uniref:Uncharacterized protein n=1 Tax=Rhynchophorus ferrugineus TaxID=354439 RepID=A0A834HZM5_RHYFE|nr:hypothetical protein GWI33_018751 [Rhynchophorus ferrugineus]